MASSAQLQRNLIPQKFGLRTEETLIRPSRKEERGSIPLSQPQSFNLIFESAPVWMLVLPVGAIKFVYLENITSLSAFSSLLDERKIDK